MDHRVIIAGAGITGTALARELTTQGIDHLVIEKRAAAAEGGLAINLPGNAIAALDRLGVANEAVSLGRPVRRREYRTATGRLLFQVDETAFWGEDFQPRAMLREDLLRILGTGLPDTSILRGCGVAGLEQNKRTIVASLDDGRELEAELLVGADGVNSRVRDAIQSVDYRQASLLGNGSWRFMAPNPGIDCWTVFAGSGAVIHLMPLNHDMAYGWAMAKQFEDERDPAALEHAFPHFPTVVHRAIESALLEPTRIYHSPLLDVRLSSWSFGRVVLAGDAAHAMAPVWAQGAALGLEDALVLAEELARTDDNRVAIGTYEARRRPRVAHVEAATDRMSRAARLPIWLRNLVMPLVGPRTYSSTYAPLRADVDFEHTR